MFGESDRAIVTSFTDESVAEEPEPDFPDDDETTKPEDSTTDNAETSEISED